MVCFEMQSGYFVDAHLMVGILYPFEILTLIAYGLNRILNYFENHYGPIVYCYY